MGKRKPVITKRPCGCRTYRQNGRVRRASFCDKHRPDVSGFASGFVCGMLFSFITGVVRKEEKS